MRRGIVIRRGDESPQLSHLQFRVNILNEALVFNAPILQVHSLFFLHFDAALVFPCICASFRHQGSWGFDLCRYITVDFLSVISG